MFEELIGKTITSIQGAEKGSKDVLFVCNDGGMYKMSHYQDCCESVEVEDVCGNIDDLLNTPVVQAFEKTNDNQNPEGVPISDLQESFTWTFYTITTIKGSVTIRWYGESNGFYSESVDFDKIN